MKNVNISKLCSLYVEKLLPDLEGKPDWYKMDSAVFSSFNHLHLYFPEAFDHMLKVWGLHEDN
jgi:hypothetical protein